jgi:hypothetical protein
MTIMAERVRPGAPPAECDGVRLDLCRMAAGGTTGRPVLELARHAQHCPPCAAFVDGLARARRWLDECVAAPPLPPDVTSLAERSRRALLRELAARLARDLQDDARQRAGRPRALRRADVRRMLALAGAATLRRDPWRGAIRLALLPARLVPSGADAQAVQRAAALRLAARLDPLGLDVALGHLAALERDGRGGAANAEADRLLALVG